jgi:tRNA uridine 5-carbamoylmethylation protein Kti12
MNKLYVLVGLPASGKSTIAEVYRKKGLSVVSIDEIRKNDLSVDCDKEAFTLINEKLKEGSVVFDACSNTKAYRKWMESEVKEPHETVCVVLNETPDVCLERLKKRNAEGHQFYSEESFKKRLMELEYPTTKEYKDIYLITKGRTKA